MNPKAADLRKIALVCHSAAGRGKGILLLHKITETLTHRAFAFTAFTSQWPAHFNEFSEVWIIGGDGTLNYFINQYPKISIPLALFKGGSGNDFAWQLYGNLSVEEYIEIVIRGSVEKVDAGVCNGKYFVNGVGIGFDGEVVKAMGSNKWYWAKVLQKIFFFREKEVNVIVRDKNWSGKLFMISIANGSRYGGSFLVAPQAKISDGNLDIVIIKKIIPVKRFYYLPRVKKGRHLDLDFVSAFTAKQIRVKSPDFLAAHLDGEPMEAKVFDIQILPGRFLFII